MLAALRFAPHRKAALLICSRSRVNAIAVEGFGESAADRYQKSRPSYSADCVKKVSDIIASNGHNAGTIRLLEIAAGTGKFTQSFLNGSHLKGVEYTATEPSEGFLAKLRELLAAEKLQSQWSVSACLGTAESIPVREPVDAIIAAQSFHWFSRIESIEAFHRALKPGKALILVWNFFDTDVEWIRELEHTIVTPIYVRLEAEMGEVIPRYINGKWNDVFQSERAKELFSPLIYSSSTIVQRASEDAIVDRVLSTSVVTRLPKEEQDEVTFRVRELLRTHKQTRGVSTFDLQYKTSVCWAYRR